MIEQGNQQTAKSMTVKRDARWWRRHNENLSDYPSVFLFGLLRPLCMVCGKKYQDVNHRYARLPVSFLRHSMQYVSYIA